MGLGADAPTGRLLQVCEPTGSVHPLDRGRDPVTVARVQGLAAEVAARHGGDLGRMRRANGVSNATWVGDGIAVRIALTPGDTAQEVALVRALPEGVGHPRVLEAGVIGGHGWVVSAEVRGENLREVWSTLTPAQQGDAIGQLWARSEILHGASPSLRRLVRSHGGYVPAGIDASTAVASRAADALGLASSARSRLHSLIEGYFVAAPVVEQVVNHGDLALMNALWDGHVVALLDVEFAVAGPIEIDLCRLVLEAGVTGQGHSGESAAPDAALEIAARRMHPEHGRALLHGAAVLDQLRDVDIWLTLENGGNGVEGWQPGQVLADLLDDSGGHLAPLLG
jgi:hypothetical protein